MSETSLFKSAELLKKENSRTEDLVLAIGKFIVAHARSLPEQYKPKSIIESRFTLAQEAFEKGMLSCGAITNISAEMLRYLGFRVKLIHGEWEGSVDHAWISVLSPDSNLWVDYDLTRPTKDVHGISASHKKKEIVDSWDEIKDQIINDHHTMMQRRNAREGN